ncbi:MAG: ATP-dependent helicase [Chitinophagaceae bacterium]|nr:ATP-dependent helicase [Chitinophagaceae bacterium]
MNRNELNQRFEVIYKNLNPEQQQAVDQIEGPVLVIAGPGTGKTQILSARIGKILLETDYLPDNILCLTYTDAGRVAMRKRLQEMIGADAYRVNIHTFHSFCNQVIQENVALFQKNSLDAVSELERISFIKEVIDQFTADNPLKRYRQDVYYEVGRLSQLFSTMKKEGWTADFIKSKVEEYIRSLPERDGYVAKRKTPTKHMTYMKGDLRTDKIAEEVRKVSVLNYAVDAFTSFQEIMHRRNRYDFDDMINWVIDVFEQHESVLLDYQERYQYLLVDEYQDTSGTQNALVNLLCKNVEKPNIFVVGDDDQSIYRFQGANVENIQAYKDRYSDILQRVVLKTNYRSTQSILDISKHVIENNKERLSAQDPEIQKELTAGNPHRLETKIHPELVIYENTFQELIGVTNHVASLLKDGVSPDQIAIIYKENKWGDELIKFFKEKNIPYYSRRKENLFILPMSRKILTILRYIAAERSIPGSGDDLLFEILHYDLYDVPPFEIAKASVRVNDEKYTKRSTLRTYLQDWINTAKPTLFENSPHESIIAVSRMLEQWIGDSFNTTILELLEKIFIDGKFLATALKDEANKLWNLEVLRTLMDFFKDELHRHPEHSLTSLIDLLDVMQDQDIALPLYRVYGNDKGVNLLTVHGSKGLEFRYVFLMNTTASTWEGKKAPNSSYVLPDTLMQTLNTTDKNSKIEEQRRLFFVAITRAEEHLYISWSKKDDKEKPLEPSQFIIEITDKTTMPRRTVSIDENSMAEFLHIYLLRNKQPQIAAGEHEIVAALLERFEMNATALNNYLSCPLKFYYQSLIRIPSGRSEASTFGSAVHHALQRLFEKMLEADHQFPELKVMLDDFKWYMYRHRESFTAEAYKRRLEYGETILKALYEKNVDHWSKIVVIEKVCKNIVIEGVPVKGMMDKLEFDGKNVTIVDYKTGKPKNAKEKLLPPTPKNPSGGDYWRQGIFYQLLINHYKLKDWQATKSVFQFVEPNESGEYIHEEILPNQEDLQTVKSQIRETWLKIQNHDFYTGCGKEDCQWCNFVKDQSIYVDLKDLKEPEEAEVIEEEMEE